VVWIFRYICCVIKKLFNQKLKLIMNKSELVDAIASKSGLSKADSKRALEGFIASTEGALKKGDKISLVGFGSFSISNRAARTGRNPQTGKEIKIAAKKVVKFKAGADLSKKVN
jgi:DNA-binding protein HU-beta